MFSTRGLAGALERTAINGNLFDGKEHNTPKIGMELLTSPPRPSNQCCARKTGRPQPVDATPSDGKVVFYETRKTVRAFFGNLPEGRSQCGLGW